MRLWLSTLARRLICHWTSSKAESPLGKGPLLERLEERVAMSGLTGADGPMACQCPFCGGAPIPYTFSNQQGPGAAYVAPTKWSQSGGIGSQVTITYSFSNLLDGGLGGGLSAAAIRSAIQEALGRWAAVAPLRFVEVADSGPAPSSNDYSAAGRPMLRFGRLSIDGPYNTLAYAYYPGGTGLAGDVFFDSGETWKVHSGQGTDLIEVATHEIGHALGLGHEPMPSGGGQQAIMNPYYGGRYSGPGTSFLYQDDINGIRALYGTGVGSVTPLGSTPISPANEAKILQSYYQRTLGRTGSAGEIQSYLVLRGQGVSWEQIAANFVNSPEANGRVVDQYYSKYLGRSADPSGRTYWVEALSNGLSREDFAISLMTSPELVSRTVTSDGYVRALYALALGRPGSAAEVAGYVQALESGATSTQIASAIGRSPEGYGRSVDEFYLNYLSRTADNVGRSYWISALASGQVTFPQLTIALLTSPEYFDRNT